MLKRTIVTVMLVLIASSTARAAEWPWQLGIAASNAGDLWTTNQTIASGRGYEVNPLMTNPTARNILKTSNTALEMLAVYQLWRTNHKKGAIITAASLIAWNGWTTVHNYRIGH